MAITPVGVGKDEYTLDSSWRDIAKAKHAIKTSGAGGLVGVGEEVGRAALFGAAHTFEGRDVKTITMRPTTTVPYGQGKANVDWDRTEKFSQVTPRQVEPQALIDHDLRASQPGIQDGALKHYLSQRQFGGTQSSGLFDKNRGEDNDTPIVFHNQDTDERVLLSGHHRVTAAVISNRAVKMRTIRGHVK